jgi:hypothetical protein
MVVACPVPQAKKNLTCTLGAPIEDNVSGLIIGWYQAHRQQGGEPDPVAEDLIAEVLAEDAAGQNTSLPPGSA